jgi:putative ABC transport system permease protein
VVGIVGDARNFGLDDEARPEVYVSYQQSPDERMRLVIRTTAAPLRLVPSVREAVRAVDKDLPFSQVMTIDTLYSKSTAQRRLNMVLLGIFAILAMLLAALGVYSVMAYTVAQRTREIGIRMALGARTADALKLVIGQGMKLALTGICIGLGGAFALTRLMKTLLFGVSDTDPLTFSGVALLIVGVAFLACLIPARRAAKVDPMVALRYE